MEHQDGVYRAARRVGPTQRRGRNLAPMKSRGIMPARLQLGRWGDEDEEDVAGDPRSGRGVGCLRPSMRNRTSPRVAPSSSTPTRARSSGSRTPTSRCPPASTTKVMTAVLALQSHRLDEQFAVSSQRGGHAAVEDRAAARAERRAARPALSPCCSSRPTTRRWWWRRASRARRSRFAEQMNLKARVIGATTTNFVNPHGLTEYGHVTTARDLSRIFRYGLGVPGFREVLQHPVGGRRHRRPERAPRHGAVAQPAAQRARLPGDRQDRVHAPRAALLRRRRRATGSREVVIAILGSTDLWGDARRMLYYGAEPRSAHAGADGVRHAAASGRDGGRAGGACRRACRAELDRAGGCGARRGGRGARGGARARRPHDACAGRRAGARTRRRRGRARAAAPLPPADEPQQLAEPAPEPDRRGRRVHGRRGSRRHRDIDGETGPRDRRSRRSRGARGGGARAAGGDPGSPGAAGDRTASRSPLPSRRAPAAEPGSPVPRATAVAGAGRRARDRLRRAGAARERAPAPSCGPIPRS